MLRKSTISLNLSNTGKLEQLRAYAVEYAQVVNFYINILWEQEVFTGSFIPKEIQEQASTWLGSVSKQCAGKQALAIVKSQRKKPENERTKPIFKGNSLDLNANIVNIFDGDNSFDLWIKFKGIGNKIRFQIPAKKHKHFNKYQDWTRKKSAKLKISSRGKFYLDIFFEKEQPEHKQIGSTVGIDCGFNKLLVTSDGQFLGTEFPEIVKKIQKKVQGSNAFKRALIERDQYVDRVVKQVDLDNTKAVVVEDLKGLKQNGKRYTKKFNNKNQRWVYPRILNRLNQHSVDPSYTSQTCSICGDIHKENRTGEFFKCRSCGYTSDSDLNASKNILNRFIFQEATEPGQQVSSLVC